MKAVILAGGVGTRLRPLSILRPKPMVRLLDKPLLEHIILLLKENGFDEICITLQYLPGMVKDYFQNGQDFGVFIEYRTEEKPLGTAGCIKACSDFIGEDPVLIVSGDAACTLNLRAFYESHIQRGADASLFIKQCLEPLEYGLVITDEGGRISSFIEKPSEDRVYSDMVNTGIYVIGKSVLDRIPEGIACDFGSELFPMLLEQGYKLYGYSGEGYWNDVGSCSAYLKTSFDFLDPKTRLYIAESAAVKPGSSIGPNVVIGSGSRIETGCHIKNSVIDGAGLGAGCTVNGSIICSGVSIGSGCHISEGSVIADNVTIGSDCYIAEGVRIWPGKTIEAGSRILRSITDGNSSYNPSFSARAVVSGEAVYELTPELAMLLGMSKAKLNSCGAACCSKGYARLIAESFLTGCQAAGREAYLLDCELPSAAAFMGRSLGLDLTLFVYQNDKKISLSFFDKNGLPISRKLQRDMEAACYNEAVRAGAESCTEKKLINGSGELYIASVMNLCGSLEGLVISAKPKILSDVLKKKGAKPVPPSDGVIELELSSDGFSLSATDEAGRRWSYGHLLCALTYIELSRDGSDKVLTLPYDAPQAAETVAESLGAKILRLNKDGSSAVEDFIKKPYASDGLYIAGRLCSYLAAERLLLKELMARLPQFHTAESEYSLSTGKGSARLLRSLAKNYPAELVSGIKINTGRGSARIIGQGSRLRILAESYSMEAAWELCTEIKEKAAALDKQ
jgi:mannose-1-phosphate guanylyltransferase/phosphomannomutase